MRLRAIGPPALLLLLLLLASSVAARHEFGSWATLGLNQHVTAAAALPTGALVRTVVSDSATTGAVRLLDGDQIKWSVAVNGTGVNLADVRYSSARSLLLATGSWKQGTATFADASKGVWSLKTTPGGDWINHFVLPVGVDGQARQPEAVRCSWDKARQPIAPLVVSDMLLDDTLVMVGPFHKTVTNGSIEQSADGFMSFVAAVRPPSSSVKLYRLSMTTDARDVVLTAIAKAEVASDFYVAGFATIDDKRVAAVMRVVLSDQGSVAAVKWMATVAVDAGAAQPYKLASVVGDDGAPMVALVGAFEKNASTTDGSWAGQCDKQRCAFVAAWHGDGEFAFARVIRAVGAASSSPLLIASHGANIIVTGPSTSTTLVGELTLVDLRGPHVFMAVFDQEGTPLALSELFDGAVSAAVFDLRSLGADAHVGGALSTSAPLTLPGLGLSVITDGSTAFSARMTPFAAPPVPDLIPVVDETTSWLSLQTVLVVGVISLVALAGLVFIWYRSRKGGRHRTTKGGRGTNKYTSVTIDDLDGDDDLDDVSVFAIGDDRL